MTTPNTPQDPNRTPLETPPPPTAAQAAYERELLGEAAAYDEVYERTPGSLNESLRRDGAHLEAQKDSARYEDPQATEYLDERDTIGSAILTGPDGSGYVFDEDYPVAGAESALVPVSGQQPGQPGHPAEPVSRGRARGVVVGVVAAVVVVLLIGLLTWWISMGTGSGADTGVVSDPGGNGAGFAVSEDDGMVAGVPETDTAPIPDPAGIAP